MRDSDLQNMMRMINDLSRINRKTIIIANNHLVDGVMASDEKRSSVVNGNVETDEVSYVRALGCGHVARPDSVAAICDVCARMVCENCIFICSRCNIHVCHRCCKIYMDKVLCTTCLWDTKRKDNVKKVFGFFVKIREEK